MSSGGACMQDSIAAFEMGVVIHNYAHNIHNFACQIMSRYVCYTCVMNESFPQRQTVQSAMLEIGMCAQQMQQEGSIDTELSELNSINTELKEGKITPEEAVARAKSIASERQSYH